MSSRYLEISYQRGRPIAAYLYLPRRSGDSSHSVEQDESGLLVDRAEDGRAIGIEITNPASVDLDSLNRVLAKWNQPSMTAAELAPLIAA